MDIWNIITVGLVAVAVPLVVIFVGHLLNGERDRLKRFNDAGEEFRKVFNGVLAETQTWGHRLYSSDNHALSAHYSAYLTFRPHLRGKCQQQYDQAWNNYCFDFKHSGNVEKDIKDLLEFTEYKLLRTIILWWQRYTYIPPPLSEEHRKLIEKILSPFPKPPHRDDPPKDRKYNTTA